jgi:hypothetical protein
MVGYFVFLILVVAVKFGTRVADIEHIRYELITFLIASRDTVSAQGLFFAVSGGLRTETVFCA